MKMDAYQSLTARERTELLDAVAQKTGLPSVILESENCPPCGSFRTANTIRSGAWDRRGEPVV